MELTRHLPGRVTSRTFALHTLHAHARAMAMARLRRMTLLLLPRWGTADALSFGSASRPFLLALPLPSLGSTAAEKEGEHENAL